MIRALTRYQFATKKLTLKLDTVKERLHQQHLFKYRPRDLKCQGFIEEMFLYGHNSYVVSTAPTSYFGLVQGLSVLDEMKFECVLLDRYSIDHVNALLSLPNARFNHQIDEASLAGQAKFTRFFTEVLPYSIDYFLTEPQKYIYNVVNEHEAIYYQVNGHHQTKDQMSIAYATCNDHKRNLVLSRPDIHYFIEDLMIQLSLEEMKSIFHSCVALVRERADVRKLADYPSDILLMIQEHAKKNFHKQLFSRWSLYNASLVHKCARTFKGAACFADQFFCQQIVDYCMLPVLPEFNHIFRSYVGKHQPSSSTLSILNPMEEREKYELQLSRPKLELIEKYVIASYLINQDLRRLAMQGENIFSSSVFKSVLSGEDIPTYLKMHESYTQILHSVQNHVLKSYVDFQLPRQYINSYTQQIQLIQQKKDEHKYEFQINDFSRLRTRLLLAHAFQNQMTNIINKRHNAGISQKETLEAVKCIKMGSYTEDSLREYIRLLHDTNASLGYPLRFPRMLAETMKNYVSNVEKDRLATQYAYSTPQEVGEDLELLNASALKHKAEPSIATPKKEEPIFSDDEAEPRKVRRQLPTEDLELQRYILGVQGSTEKFPHDISELSFDELRDLGFQTVGEQDFKITAEGEIITDDPIDDELRRELQDLIKPKK